MEYIAKRADKKLSNEPYLITYDDLRRMYEENQQDAELCKQITNNRSNESSTDPQSVPETPSALRHNLYREILFYDPKTTGFVMVYPHGVVIRQGERGSYYRGETRVYTESGTTLSRALKKISTKEDRLLYCLIADMRIAEFDHFIHMFKRVCCWGDYGLTVLTEPLAQHYGLETDWLDITNDFNTALFFATCYWERGQKRWYPLTKKQTEEGIDGDIDKTRYGVIFHAPSQRIILGNMLKSTAENYEGKVLPIGYQPFMRCHSQYGYGLYMKHSIPLQENLMFEKLHFRHNEKLSQRIYEMMDGGKKIYPEEGLDGFYDIIDNIIHATNFSEEAFLSALEKNGLTEQSDKYRLTLEKSRICPKPILICGNEHPFRVARQRIRRANRKDEHFSIEKNYGIRLGTRMVYAPDNTD